MKLISEKRNFNNQTVAFIWHPAKQLDLPVWQVYVFCVAKDNKVILVRDKGEDRFTLPEGEQRREKKPKRQPKEKPKKRPK